jgi:hypothetical protein
MANFPNQNFVTKTATAALGCKAGPRLLRSFAAVGKCGGMARYCRPRECPESSQTLVTAKRLAAGGISVVVKANNLHALPGLHRGT